MDSIRESTVEDGEHLCPASHQHKAWCYNAHACRCTACKTAIAATQREQRERRKRRDNKPTVVNSAPITRRMQALAVMGYSLEELSEILDLDRESLGTIRRGDRRTVLVSTAAKVISTYRKLWMTRSSGPSSRQVSRRAIELGYKSPVHWINIDGGV